MLLPVGVGVAVLGLSLLTVGLFSLGSVSPELPRLRAQIKKVQDDMAALDMERKDLHTSVAEYRDAIAVTTAQADELERAVLPLRARSLRLIQEEKEARRDLTRNAAAMQKVVDATNARAVDANARLHAEGEHRQRTAEVLRIGQEVVGSLVVDEAQIGSCFLVDSARGPIFLALAGRLQVGQRTIGKMTVRAPGDVRRQVVVPLRVDHIDERIGVAVLRITRSGLRVTVPVLSRDKPIAQGDPVHLVATVIVGEGGMMEHSAFAGHVTGRRDVDGMQVWQTDLPANPGADGGPVLDADGVVLGMHVSPGERIERTAFFIPATALRMVIAGFERATGGGGGR